MEVTEREVNVVTSLYRIHVVQHQLSYVISP